MTAAAPPRAAPRTDPRPGVTAIVLTLDEAEHLPGCLATLGFADGVIVVDSGSRDATCAIAAAAGATVAVHPFVNYSRQRQHALTLSPTRWVLFVDADERVPPALADAVRRAVGAADGDGAVCGYWIPRRNLFWGRALRGGGWWPDRQLRLLDAGRAHFDPDRAVHERAALDGPSGVLDHPLEHLNYASWAEFRAKQRRYAALDAERRRAEGWRFRPRQLVGQPLRVLFDRFVRLGGWRDGGLGLALALHMAWYEVRTLWRLRRAR